MSTARGSEMLIPCVQHLVLYAAAVRPSPGASAVIRIAGAEVEPSRSSGNRKNAATQRRTSQRGPARPAAGSCSHRRGPALQPGVDDHHDRHDDYHLQRERQATFCLARDHLAGQWGCGSAAARWTALATSAAAVAYAANALANSSSAEPRKPAPAAGRRRGASTAGSWRRGCPRPRATAVAGRPAPA